MPFGQKCLYSSSRLWDALGRKTARSSASLPTMVLYPFCFSALRGTSRVRNGYRLRLRVANRAKTGSHSDRHRGRLVFIFRGVEDHTCFRRTRRNVGGETAFWSRAIARGYSTDSRIDRQRAARLGGIGAYVELAAGLPGRDHVQFGFSRDHDLRFGFFGFAAARVFFFHVAIVIADAGFGSPVVAVATLIDVAFIAYRNVRAVSVDLNDRHNTLTTRPLVVFFGFAFLLNVGVVFLPDAVTVDVDLALGCA